VKLIFCDIEKCLACRSCEIACAVAHSGSKNLMDALREETVPKQRIHVVAVDDKGSLTPTHAIALQCRHCHDAPCIEACITDCIQRDEKTGNIVIEHEECVGCWACIKVCPFGAIVQHKDLNIVVICDHCPDREMPACVEACRTHALVYCDREEIEIDYAEKLKLRKS
jgi:carbon-monoxide dehydrogenase iron sulfur subunit